MFYSEESLRHVRVSAYYDTPYAAAEAPLPARLKSQTGEGAARLIVALLEAPAQEPLARAGSPGASRQQKQLKLLMLLIRQWTPCYLLSMNI